MPHSRFLRIREVMSKTGLSRSSIYAKEAIGHFPSRIQMGPNSVAWLEEEIDLWMDELKNKSRVKPLTTLAPGPKRRKLPITVEPNLAQEVAQ